MRADGPLVRVVMEGTSDLAAVEKVVASRGAHVDLERAIIAGGKTNLDPRIHSYNAAAKHGAWFVLRDADHDGHDCPVALRNSLLPEDQKTGSLCLRLAVRSLEAWLLADRDAVVDHFLVPRSRIPARPEEEHQPKQTFVNACRSSRRSDVRKGVVPPAGSPRDVGPEYVAFATEFFQQSWRPDEAATAAPSLKRALAEIDQLIVDGVWA